MKSKLIETMLQKDMLTENGMVTNSTSLDPLVDLFFVIGAMRKEVMTDTGKARLISKFEAAYAADALIATKVLFWARNVRGGAGEREVFKVLMNYLAKNRKSAAEKNIALVPEFGRWDDLFAFIDTPFENAALNVYAKGLKNKNALAAKWAPRLGGKVPKQKKYFANKLRAVLGKSAKEYRKMLVDATEVVETPMCNKEYSVINFEHVPSLAMSRYTKAFQKNDELRFNSFINKVKSGEAKINANAVYPYNVIQTLQVSNSDAAVEQWKALPDYLEGSTENLICVVDVSGSMSTPVAGNTTAMNVALSLGLYVSERSKGLFENAFITFSSRPELQYLNGDLRARLAQLKRAHWDMNTDLEAVFKLILSKAQTNGLDASELPSTILIMSDMEFDSCVKNRSNTAYEMIDRMYEEAGYKRPNVIFWNIASRSGQVPVRFDENGTGLVSGFSPAILKDVLSGDVNPVKIMLRAISAPDYDKITV